MWAVGTSVLSIVVLGTALWAGGFMIWNALRRLAVKAAVKAKSHPMACSANQSEVLRELIDRGREIPPDMDVQDHATWTTTDKGVTLQWSRLSILVEVEDHLHNQRLPILLVRQSMTDGSRGSSAQAGEPLPVVIISHGTSRGKGCPMIRPTMEHFACKGWAAMSFDNR